VSELRKDPVIDRWVIIATERGKRPTDFVTAEPHDETGICPFDEGNEHMTPHEIFAVRNPDTLADRAGWKIRVVPNKYPALHVEGSIDRVGLGMFDQMNGIGAHEVIIETPKHYDPFHNRPVEHIVDIIDVCQRRITDLHRDFRLQYVLVFKNHGIRAGATLTHEHSQIIATPIIPKRVNEEIGGSLEYFNYKSRCVFCDIIREEKRFSSRIVYENASFITFCPYASRFPFEIWLLPKRHMAGFTMVTRQEMIELADCLRVTMKGLAVSLDEPQYNWILHSEPNPTITRNPWPDLRDHYHWHFEIIPKLTRVAGFEWGTGIYINPTPPEEAATFLREVGSE
jgi:UDPglucose--hexose-1-phosphate uridylyltransferase